MNISSLIINLKDEKFTQAIAGVIEDIQECELIAKERDKIVVVVTTLDTDKQIAIFRFIEALEGVDSAGMVYSYEELNEDIEKMGRAPKISEILDDEFDAKKVVYSGSIHYKTK